MTQTIRKKLKVPTISRNLIAVLAGASPFLLALIMMFYTRFSTISNDAGWVKYLVQHQDDIIQSLIVSSVMVAVFSTLLRNKTAAFAAGFQPVLIQATFILTDPSLRFPLNVPISAITVLPLLILLITLGRDIGQNMTEKR